MGYVEPGTKGEDPIGGSSANGEFSGGAYTTAGDSPGRASYCVFSIVGAMAWIVTCSRVIELERLLLFDPPAEEDDGRRLETGLECAEEDEERIVSTVLSSSSS